ncbi:MAG: lipocalin-like domain-containing protein [Gemmatimonadota bacterium]
MGGPVGAGLAIAVGALLAACGDGGPGGDRAAARLSLSETLSGADTAGYERALEIRDFDFPADHGPHPGFRTEWWYVTGNLTDKDARSFGFQFTIFRSALAPMPPALDSKWATNQAYMGHFTLTDVAAGTFRAFERFARGAAGLAGAELGAAGRDVPAVGPSQRSAPPAGSAQPWIPPAGSGLRVWIEDWSLTGVTEGNGFPMRMRASEDGVSLDLRLDAGKPVVFQGDRGLSQKGPEPGNASYYYAHTRLPASGTVVIQADTFDVSGLAWMDREWSTSALSGDQVGWDWFSLQLDDGWEVMVYQLRLADGTPDPLSDGVLIDPDGEKIPLEWGTDVRLEPTGSWTSPIDGARYPSGWRLLAPSQGVDLRIEPVLDDQELDLAFRYWEGAVDVHGTGAGGVPVSGRGYVELTGYAGDVRGR